jgi:lambda repressor-like predicted transcriptional regulator
MTDTSFTITDLQSKWGTLHDLDRARAVRAIHQSGTSLNELAKALKRSPSLLRHLLKTLQAPRVDQLLARNGKLTTNQLVRRAEAAEISLATKQREAEAVKRTQASLLPAPRRSSLRRPSSASATDHQGIHTETRPPEPVRATR